MKRLLTASIPLMILAGMVLLQGHPRASAEPVTKPIKLFNGKDMTNFYTFLRGYGKNKDPKKVFTVKDGMIRVSGEVFGYFVTEKEFEDYHLIVEYKYGDETSGRRKGRARDSGVLLHCVGEDGAANGVWMESIECQVIEGGTGDFILVKGEKRPSIWARAEKRGGQWYYNPDAELRKFTSNRINWYARSPKFKDVVGFRGENDVEKPHGEWNRLECICDGGSITNILNGKVVNKGIKASHTKGKILFQSEGAELFYRRIDLKPLKK